MDQLRIFVIVLNLRFLLTSFKISGCRSEERYKRATGKGKQEYNFHRYMSWLFQTITVTVKPSFKRYTNKK